MKNPWKVKPIRIRPIRTHFNLDTDNDFVPDFRDCQPFNKHRQDEDEYQIGYKMRQGIKPPYDVGLDISRENWFGFDAIKATIRQRRINPDLIKGFLDAPPNENVISFQSFPSESKDILSQYGFLNCPKKIKWSSPTMSLNEYIKSVPKGRDIKRALNSIEEGKRNEPVHFIKEEDLSPNRYSKWHNIYKRKIESFSRGRLNAPKEPPKKHFGLYAFEDGNLLGGRIIKEFPEHISASYDAFQTDRKYINELAYAMMMQEAYQSGKKKVSLGVDTNFYGYHMPPGVYKSKRSFGFSPYPYKKPGSHMFKVTDPSPFTDPYMFLSYDGSKNRLTNNIYLRSNKSISERDYNASGGVRVYYDK